MLHDPALVHDEHTVAKRFHYAEFLVDEQARKAKAFPQLLQKCQYLRLHGYVQRRDWLVGDNHRWAFYKYSRYRDTLAS
ncbi:hypothetical protein SAMN05421772_12439 [Paracoccus saliphilus]|uniref:Uncharacterized protein n=1 Tax=Paracoccus saliphilus TaxID=405559 RepID=A0AA45W858_9RHOB|nr:hypothetical protein SAMN05421772_12439 [Paracoccus saliphilus]